VCQCRSTPIAPVYANLARSRGTYNAQVFELQERLSGARIGTVDKFQGQEAPIVIYSLTTSTQADAPHGMEFLYSLNRLNVATSRARCMCVLVASPDVFEPECRTPRQIQPAKSGHFKPEKFKDHYEDALKELLRKKQSGRKIEVPREHAPAKVINLMDALRRSVDAERGGRGEGEQHAAPSRRTPKKAARSNARKRTG
jgi:AAA domain